jgi:hypothetical protein
MSLLPDLAISVVTGELGLVIGSRAERTQMLELSAVLALSGPVRVLDGGNSYNTLYVARYIRRQTVQLDEALKRICVARAFTCYQMVTLLQQTACPRIRQFPVGDVEAVSPSPTLVLDLLATFSDESIDLKEAVRLLRMALAQLQRLCRRTPVVVSLRPFPSHQSERTILIEMVRAAATHHFVREPLGTAVQQLSLLPIGLR